MLSLLALKTSKNPGIVGCRGITVFKIIAAPRSGGPRTRYSPGTLTDPRSRPCYILNPE
jgi:hypothetical protein